MRTRRSNHLRSFGRFLRSLFVTALLAAVVGWLAYQGWMYWHSLTHLPGGTSIGEVDVAGMTREEALDAVQAAYGKPIIARYGDNMIEINPADAGFVLDAEGMVAEAVAQTNEIPHWKRYLARVVGRPLPGEAIAVRLRASHAPDEVRLIVDLLGEMLDTPAEPPALLAADGQIGEGRDGVLLDRQQAQEAIRGALYHPADRLAELTLQTDEAPEMNLSYLEDYLRQQLELFDGFGSIYILDLQTGEEIKINADSAVSGLSIIKIAIMLETLRKVDGPLSGEQQKLMEETAILSGNFSANLLLDVIAGQDNAYLGSDILTESMRQLGLDNTFIVTPYDEPERPERRTLRTPGNSQVAISFDPDPAMQTTAEDIGQLLGMIYYCGRGGGALIAVYPDQITPAECQLLVELMARNVEGNLIRFGVPEEMTVAHKHGWAYNTHGDAGIVFTPGGDYVIAEYLYADTDWMPVSLTFPLLREISRSVYNYFNAEAPYADHKRAQREAGIFAAHQAVKAAATAAQDGGE